MTDRDIAQDVKKHNKATVGLLRMAIGKAMRTDEPLLVLGAPGLGKSEIIAQEAAAHGYIMCDGVRASQIEPADVGGIPYADAEKQEVVRFMPDVIATCWNLYRDQKDENDKPLSKERRRPVLLFLDELTSGVPSVMAAIYSIVLERRAAGYSLPPRTRIVAAGNTAKDRSIAYEMPRAMAGRFSILEYLGPTWKEWEPYALRTGVHPSVIGFIQSQPDYLCEKPNPDDDEGRQPNPRSWVRASKGLWDADKHGFGHADRLFLLSMDVGDHAALQMEAVLRMGDKMATFEEIMADPMKAQAHKNNLAVSYMQMTLILARLTNSSKPEHKEEFNKAHEYMTRLPNELMGAFMRTLVLTKPAVAIHRRDLYAKYAERASAGKSFEAARAARVRATI